MGSRGPATVTAFRGPNGKVGLTVFIFIEKTVWHFFCVFGSVVAGVLRSTFRFFYRIYFFTKKNTQAMNESRLIFFHRKELFGGGSSKSEFKGVRR